METFSTRGEMVSSTLHDLPRDPRIALHARTHVDGLRWQAPRRLGNGHGRMHAVAAGLVGAGRDHAPLAGLGADHQGKAAPLGMIALLDRGEEGVEIDMHDEAGHAR